MHGKAPVKPDVLKRMIFWSRNPAPPTRIIFPHVRGPKWRSPRRGRPRRQPSCPFRLLQYIMIKKEPDGRARLSHRLCASAPCGRARLSHLTLGFDLSGGGIFSCIKNRQNTLREPAVASRQGGFFSQRRQAAAASLREKNPPHASR